MRHDNGAPTKRHRLTALSAILAVAFGFVGLVVIVGPAKAFDWGVAYLIPAGVILGGVIAALVLLMWALKKLPTSVYRDWWQ